MFGEELRELVRRGVTDLDTDVEFIESLLAAAKDARGLFRGVLSPAEVDSVNLQVDYHETRHPSRHRALEIATPVAGDPVAGSQAHAYPEFEQKLRDAGVGASDDLVVMAKVWADMHDGVVLSRALAMALRAMGFSQSSMTNLPSYLSRKMFASQEFERLGRRGSGRYRWLSYRDYPACGDASGESVDGEGPVTSGFSGDGTDPIV